MEALLGNKEEKGHPKGKMDPKLIVSISVAIFRPFRAGTQDFRFLLQEPGTLELIFKPQGPNASSVSTPPQNLKIPNQTFFFSDTVWQTVFFPFQSDEISMVELGQGPSD